MQALPDDTFSVEGYFKNFSVLFVLPPYTQEETTIDFPEMGAVNNRLRLKLSLRSVSWLSFHFAYDISPRIQDHALFEENTLFVGLRLLEYRVTDFRERLYPEPGEPLSSFALFHNLDRFSMTIATPFADIFIGRQAIAWGSARVINPTDIIAPFTFNELDREERRGVDAVRVRIPLGMMDELDMGFVAGKHFAPDKNAYFLRGKFYVFKTDVSLILLGFRKHLLIGADFARSIGGAGFWLETAYVIPDFFREGKNPEEKHYFRASVGLDYNLTSKTYGFVEYHFNSAGRDNPDFYLGLFNSSAYQDGSVYLMGRHYVNIGCMYQLSPLISSTGIFIYNASDGSFILSPLIEYNIAENIYLSAGAYISIGKNPELVLGPLVPLLLRLRSEFGTYPEMVFTSFRIYF